MSWLPIYPCKRGYYTVRELKILAIVLGYDGNIFQRGLKRRGIDITKKASYSDAEVTSWLDSNVFLLDLDNVFNNYPADYNVKVIKRAIFHLSHHLHTYQDLANSRKAFETLTAKERQLSLSTDTKQVLFALKMVDRILSPLKLQHILQTMSHHLDESPETLNFYDFLDVVARAEKINMSKIKNTDKDDVLQLDSLFKTPYHRLLTLLDDEYKKSLDKTGTRKTTQISFEEKKKADAAKSSISTSFKKKMAKATSEEDQCIGPSVKSTNNLIQYARAGKRAITCEVGIRALSRMSQRTQCRSRRTHTAFY